MVRITDIADRSDVADPTRRHLLGAGFVAVAATGLSSVLPSAVSAATRPTATQDTAPNLFVDAGGVRFAYRRLGAKQGVPIVLLQHFIGTMDWWDPMLTDTLARSRPVILFDNRGVGLSSGETPDTVDQMAKDAAAFIDALGLKQVDVLGFSIGGMVAQELVLDRPDLVRRLILAGTGPRGGTDMQETPPNVIKAVSVPNPSTARPYLFFAPSSESQDAAARFMVRVTQRKSGQDPKASGQTMQAQGVALHTWGIASSAAPFADRLRTIKQPTMVVNGSNDIMVPTVNSYLLVQSIPKSQLIIYPDSGHGSIFQYADLFVQHANLFLDRRDGDLS